MSGASAKRPPRVWNNWSPDSVPMAAEVRPTIWSADAYATGEALRALHGSGMSPSDPVCRRGVDFLLSTQQNDGTGPLSRFHSPRNRRRGEPAAQACKMEAVGA